MTDAPASKPINQPRRRDRQVTDEGWIISFLEKTQFGDISTDYEGQPFTNAKLFVYDPLRHAIYFHTANAGRTLTNVLANPRVCFSASQMGRLLPADTAMGMSVEFSSVTIFGKAVVVTDDAEAAHGLQILLDKYFPHMKPGADYRAIQPEELARTCVYRIDIESWSAKKKEVDPNFPGAFFFGEINQES